MGERGVSAWSLQHGVEGTVGRDGACPLGVGSGGGVEEDGEERGLVGRRPWDSPSPRVQLDTIRE
jgi:hypothetical protein